MTHYIVFVFLDIYFYLVSEKFCPTLIHQGSRICPTKDDNIAISRVLHLTVSISATANDSHDIIPTTAATIVIAPLLLLSLSSSGQLYAQQTHDNGRVIVRRVHHGDAPRRVVEVLHLRRQRGQKRREVVVVQERL